MALFGKKQKKNSKQPASKPQAVVPRKQKPARSKKQRSGDAEKIAYRVIIKPQITEKAGRLGADNQYVFRVAKRAGKQEIAQAVQELYGVKPIRVNTVSIPGKVRRLGRTQGSIPGYKKAYVTLPEGKTIELNA